MTKKTKEVFLQASYNTIPKFNCLYCEFVVSITYFYKLNTQVISHNNTDQSNR